MGGARKQAEQPRPLAGLRYSTVHTWSQRKEIVSSTNWVHASAPGVFAHCILGDCGETHNTYAAQRYITLGEFNE